MSTGPAPWSHAAKTYWQRRAGDPSSIGLGCMGLSQGYGPADDGESIRVIHRLSTWDVTMLDTAMSYGQGT